MNAYEIARAEATRVVEAAYRKAVAAGELPEGTIPPVAVETPKDSSNGDWASTFAMQCAKPLHMAPRKIAESIVANLDLEGSCFDTVTIAGPGFMNFTLNQAGTSRLSAAYSPWARITAVPRAKSRKRSW